MHICFLGKKSYAGEIKTKKSHLERVKNKLKSLKK